jgi:hypothetical protein
MDFQITEGGGPDLYRAALNALPEPARAALEEIAGRKNLANDDPFFELVIILAQFFESVKGPSPKKLSELLLNHAAQLSSAKSAMAASLEALKKHEADAEARAAELGERTAEVKAAIDKDQEERRKTSDLLSRRTADLEHACNRLRRARTRLSWGWLALAAGAGFVAYPFVDRFLLSPFGL